jgi:hypothetical protein
MTMPFTDDWIVVAVKDYGALGRPWVLTDTALRRFFATKTPEYNEVNRFFRAIQTEADNDRIWLMQQREAATSVFRLLAKKKRRKYWVVE